MIRNVDIRMAACFFWIVAVCSGCGTDKPARVELQAVHTSAFNCQCPAAWSQVPRGSTDLILRCPEGFLGTPKEVIVHIASNAITDENTKKFVNDASERGNSQVTKISVAGIESTRITYERANLIEKSRYMNYTVLVPGSLSVTTNDADRDSLLVIVPHIDAMLQTLQLTQ
ncbi:MAG: hypothetical protein R3C53_09515 [Pirellulaceae bacterium]